MSPRDERVWRAADAALAARYELGRRVFRIQVGEDYDADGFDRFVAAADAAYDRECDRVKAWAEVRASTRTGTVAR